MTELLSPQVGMVLLYGLITAVATGLGALPFLFMRRVSPRNVAIANALASGLMLGASSGLLLEGARYGVTQTVIGGALGVAFILAGERLLQGREVEFGDLKGAGARKILLILAVMTLHSFSEGVAVGVSFGGGLTLATAITAAIAVHNIPEGVAITAVLRPRGVGLWQCAGWSVLSSLPAWRFIDPLPVFASVGQRADDDDDEWLEDIVEGGVATEPPASSAGRAHVVSLDLERPAGTDRR